MNIPPLFSRAERVKVLITVPGASSRVVDPDTLYITCPFYLLDECKQAVATAAQIKRVFAQELGWDGKGFTVVLRAGH